jgi:PAS domain S-box-containing protein
MLQPNITNNSSTLNKLQGLVKILVVHDLPPEAQQLEIELDKNGIKADWVATVEEAVKKIKNGHFDGLLLNTSAKHIDAIEAIRAIRSQSRNLPIVVLSDKDDKALALETLKSGGQDYLVKGKIRIDSIARCLRYAIERQRIRYEILLEGERSTRLIIENSLQAFLAMDQNGIILDWNLRAEGLFGWSRHEAIGKSIRELIRPSPTRDVYIENLDKILSDSPEGILNKRMEVYAIHKEGHQFPIEFGIFRIKDKTEYLYCTFINDISDRKEIEKKTKELNEELERRVQERTSELMRSNQELQQFAKIASHDLQEPLRAIQGFAQLLARRYHGQLNEDGNQFIEFILDGTQRMQKLIQSVLEHSSISTNEQEIEAVDVSSVIREVIKNLNHSIMDSKATVVFGELPQLAIERSQLIQLFQNLISNAIKYAGEKTPYIVISAEKSVDEWIFSVQDNGIGIDNKYTDRIFDMFARLHGRIKYSGTGMGLAICKKIVTATGGKIWMESESGEGSIFFFTLPAKKEPKK